MAASSSRKPPIPPPQQQSSDSKRTNTAKHSISEDDIEYGVDSNSAGRNAKQPRVQTDNELSPDAVAGRTLRTPVKASLMKGYDWMRIHLLEKNRIMHVRSKAPKLPVDTDQHELLPNSNNADNSTLSDTLHQAARTGDAAGLKLLLDAIALQPRATRAAQINLLDETGSAPLHYAARYHHINIAKILLAAGADANVKGEDGQTPLHFACRHKVKLNKTATTTGASNAATSATAGRTANAQQPASAEQTVLAPAVVVVGETFTDQPSAAGQTSTSGTTATSLVQLLVRAGADLSIRDRYGNTPLHIAVMRGNENTVRELLEFPQVSVDIVDESKQTPLHIAALNGQSVEILRMLINRTRSNLRNVDANLNTPLHLASAQGNLEAVKILLNEVRRIGGSGGRVAGAAQPAVASAFAAVAAEQAVRDMLHDKDDENQIPLVLAVEGGHLEVAEVLITAGSSIDYPNDNLDTSLHIAANRGDLDMCHLLVAHDATLEACNSRHQTPLHRAAALNRLAVADYLVTIGANIEATDQNAWTPMLIASRHGHVDMVRKLIGKGANIYAVSKRDRNALFLAASSNHPRTVQALLDSPWGSELMFRNDRYGLFPIHIACKKGHSDVVRVMIRRGAPIDERLEDEKTPLHLAAQFGWHQIVTLITNENTDLVNYEDENGDTALHLAALNGHLETVRKLLSIGASIASRNSNQWTPLGNAASRGHAAVCEELLRGEAPIDPKDKNGTTPLHFASLAGFLTTVKILIEFGASISCRNADGKNCLDFAVENGHRSVAKYIIQTPKWRDAMRNDQYVIGHGTRGGGGGKPTGFEFNPRASGNSNVFRDTPMRKLIKLMPDVAYLALNMCIETRGQSDDLNYTVLCNFEFIDDTFCDWVLDAPTNGLNSNDTTAAAATAATATTTATSANQQQTSTRLRKTHRPYTLDKVVLKDNHPLSVMVRHKQEDLLTHPLITCLIQTKWSLYGGFAFFSTFVIYGIFLTFYTGFTLVSHPLNRLYIVNTDTSSKTFNTTWVSDLCPPGTPWPLTYDVNALDDYNQICQVIESARDTNGGACSMQFLDDNSNSPEFLLFHSAGQIILPMMSLAILSKELMQLIVLRAFGNITTYAVHIMTIIVTIPWEGASMCYYQYGLMGSWKWQMTSFNIFLAWIQLVLLLRNFPWIGLYVQMLEDVTITVMRFFPVFFLVLTAFSLGFYLAFKGSARHNQVAHFIESVYDSDFQLNPFYSIPQSYVKTFTMFVGEFDQENHFQNTNQPVILVLYVIFLLVCTIIIVNLMIGLAVQDIKALQEHAALKRVAMRIDLVLTVERLMPLSLRAKLFRYKAVLHPNREAAAVAAASSSASTTTTTANVAAGQNTAKRIAGNNNRALEVGGRANGDEESSTSQCCAGFARAFRGLWARVRRAKKLLGSGGTTITADDIARARKHAGQHAGHSAGGTDTKVHGIDAHHGTTGEPQQTTPATTKSTLHQSTIEPANTANNSIVGGPVPLASIPDPQQHTSSSIAPLTTSDDTVQNFLAIIQKSLLTSTSTAPASLSAIEHNKLDSDGKPTAVENQQQNFIASSAVLLTHEQLIRRVDAKLADFQDEIMRALTNMKRARGGFNNNGVAGGELVSSSSHPDGISSAHIRRRSSNMSVLEPEF